MKATYRLPYGKSELQFQLPEGLSPEWIVPREVAAHPAPERALQEALHNQLGDPGIGNLSSHSTVAVAVLDASRPGVNHLLLPPLLDWLEAKGIAHSKINLFMASGVHPPPSPAELEQILPLVARQACPITLHDPDDQPGLLNLGTTTRGTPVWIRRGFCEADLRIALGNIAPHQFQGFSGGGKAAAIGLAGRETIERNHALMMHPDSSLDSYSKNPCRQDVEEIGEICSIQLALSVVLNREGALVATFAGTPRAVMDAGIPVCRESSCVCVGHDFDVLIASAGGHPRDINLYQAQKALAHAALITRDGGAVILAAACPQGTGSKAFDAAIPGMHTPAGVIERFRRDGFRLGAHKAFQIARDAQRCQLFLVSDLVPDLVTDCLLHPATSIEAALQAMPFDIAGMRIGIMPRAATTIPLVQ